MAAFKALPPTVASDRQTHAAPDACLRACLQHCTGPDEVLRAAQLASTFSAPLAAAGAHAQAARWCADIVSALHAAGLAPSGLRRSDAGDENKTKAKILPRSPPAAELMRTAATLLLQVTVRRTQHLAKAGGLEALGQLSGAVAEAARCLRLVSADGATSRHGAALRAALKQGMAWLSRHAASDAACRPVLVALAGEHAQLRLRLGESGESALTELRAFVTACAEPTSEEYAVAVQQACYRVLTRLAAGAWGCIPPTGAARMSLYLQAADACEAVGGRQQAEALLAQRLSADDTTPPECGVAVMQCLRLALAGAAISAPRASTERTVKTWSKWLARAAPLVADGAPSLLTGTMRRGRKTGLDM